MSQNNTQATLIDISAAVGLVTALLTNATRISALIQQATQSGSHVLTVDQWSQIIGADDSAEASLISAIAAAKARTPSGSAPA
jgi:hypothetical protein